MIFITFLESNHEGIAVNWIIWIFIIITSINCYCSQYWNPLFIMFLELWITFMQFIWISFTIESN
jgi:hypothetical protein